VIVFPDKKCLGMRPQLTSLTITKLAQDNSAPPDVNVNPDFATSCSRKSVIFASSKRQIYVKFMYWTRRTMTAHALDLVNILNYYMDNCRLEYMAQLLLNHVETMEK
jgi:hypothetical protein